MNQRPSLVWTSRSTRSWCWRTRSMSAVRSVVQEVVVDVRELTAAIDRQQAEDIARPWREHFDARGSIEKDRADLGGVDQVVNVVVGLNLLLYFDLQLLVDRTQFLVQRLQLLLACFQFFGRRAELLVHRLQLFVRGLQLFGLRFVAFDRRPQLRLQPDQLVFELAGRVDLPRRRRDGVRRRRRRIVNRLAGAPGR